MKVVNMFGAPGVGKTTKALKTTALLKEMQIDAEISLEVVKPYIYAGTEKLLAYQNYIFADQDRHIRFLLDSREAEFAITDSPLLLPILFAAKDQATYFKDLVFETFNGYDNINFFIHRNHPYSFNSRIHNEEQSILFSKKLYAFLVNNNIPFIELNSTDSTEEIIISHLLKNRDSEYPKIKKIRK
jgi:hypothetical protein